MKTEPSHHTNTHKGVALCFQLQSDLLMLETVATEINSDFFKESLLHLLF